MGPTENQVELHEILSEQKKTGFFTAKAVQHWHRVVQGGCGVSIPGVSQSPAGHNPGDLF